MARRAAKVAPAETKPSVFNPRRKLRGSIQAVILTNRIAKHNVLAREDVATLMDLREALATVVTAEDETPLRGALDALWASDLPPTTMLHVRRIQTGNISRRRDMLYGQRRGPGRGQARVVRGVTRAFHSLPCA